MAGNHPEHEFQTDRSGKGMFAAKKQETVLEAQTRALNVPRYRFLQRVKCGYEMAWDHPKHEFQTEIVDWACSLRQNKKWFWRHKLVHLMHPILIFTMGQVQQQNGVKPTETRVLDKECGAKPNGCFRATKWCANTQNMSFGTNGVH